MRDRTESLRRAAAAAFLSTSPLFAAAAALAPAPARAGTQTFDFEDPKGVNAVSFFLDAPIEAILGVANRVTGRVVFDPFRPGDTTGKIVVDAASLIPSNPSMIAPLHGDRYLDVERYPTIDFEMAEIVEIRTTSENVFEGRVRGSFTCHGVTQDLEVPIQATYLPDALGQRIRIGPDETGDLLVLRTSFVIHRSDFGIAPDTPAMKVADAIQIQATLGGMVRRPRGPLDTGP